MAKDILVINGPNLNMLGLRQPEVYGSATLADVESNCSKLAGHLKVQLRFAQSNSEAEIIGWIHEARKTASAIIINPGAYSHTSIAILDALNTFEGPVLEVHISNIHKRESFRHHSYVSHRADGVIAGCGIEGYELALRRVVSLLS